MDILQVILLEGQKNRVFIEKTNYILLFSKCFQRTFCIKTIGRATEITTDFSSLLNVILGV